MKVRKIGSGMSDKVEQQMTPMIDVVFQLLAFFVFTLKISVPEGDFRIKMPVASDSPSTLLDPTIPIKVTLKADEQGKLTGILMNEKPVKNFGELRSRVAGIVGNVRGPGSAYENTEVELDCDYGLRYEYAVEAITSVSGYLDSKENQIVQLIRKIRFSPPKSPPKE